MFFFIFSKSFSIDLSLLFHSYPLFCLLLLPCFVFPPFFPPLSSSNPVTLSGLLHSNLSPLLNPSPPFPVFCQSICLVLRSVLCFFPSLSLIISLMCCCAVAITTCDSGHSVHCLERLCVCVSVCVFDIHVQDCKRIMCLKRRKIVYLCESENSRTSK